MGSVFFSIVIDVFVLHVHVVWFIVFNVFISCVFCRGWIHFVLSFFILY